MVPLLIVLLAITTATAQQWRQLGPTGVAPSPRNNASAIYDPVAHRLVVFGGRSSKGDLNDLWSLDLNLMTWSELSPAVAIREDLVPDEIFLSVARV